MVKLEFMLTTFQLLATFDTHHFLLLPLPLLLHLLPQFVQLVLSGLQGLWSRGETHVNMNLKDQACGHRPVQKSS